MDCEILRQKTDLDSEELLELCEKTLRDMTELCTSGRSEFGSRKISTLVLASLDHSDDLLLTGVFCLSVYSHRAFRCPPLQTRITFR